MQFALPDLAGFVAAGLLLLLACALSGIIYLLANSLGKAPVIGGWVTRDVNGWLTDARNALLKASSATWHFATGMINWAWDILTKPLIYLYHYATAAWQWLNVLFTQTIPDAENRVLNYALSRFDAAEADAAHLFTVAERYTGTEIAAAEHLAAELFAEAESYAGKAVAAAETALAADIRAVQQAAAADLTAAERALTSTINSVATAADKDLASLAGQTNTDIGRLANDVVSEVTKAEAIAAANLAAVQAGIYTDLEQWGDQAVSHVWPDAAQDIAALKQTLGADFPWLNDLLGALGGLGSVGIAGALIRAIAGAEVVTNLADQCIIPNCRNLSQFGQDLQDLLSAASEAALLAWLVFLVADPQGWANDMATVAAPVAATVTADIARLLGQG